MALALVAVALLAGGCSRSSFEPPDLQGRPMMVHQDGQPRLWVLTKQEETRTVGVGGSGRTMRWREDTFFHFRVQAFDPATVQPLWAHRLLTLGDTQASGTRPSRVIGSSAAGKLLGQDGNVVWVLIDQKPFAVNVVDGTLLSDAAGLEQRNPELLGLLPSDASHYSFDRGLVLLAADARRFVVRGPGLVAQAYVPASPPPPPPPDLKSNGSPRIVPLLPFGEVPTRLAKLDGRWLALYSEKEAADAADDDWGENLRYPYQILDEGAQVRRSMWSPRIVSAQRFDEVFDRIESLEPIPGAPSFLKGRFFRDLATGEPMAMSSPSGLMVWHRTRIDSAGRLALTRLDDKLRTLWTTELPLSESSITTPVIYWQLPDKVVVMGTLENLQDDVSRQEQYLVAVSLADGKRQAWNLVAEKPLP
ncbi:MAG: hypothetical protein NT046_10800 [Arenimonas sp.]|nr:hypothetical protein [Arenimonas sp.]